MPETDRGKVGLPGEREPRALRRRDLRGADVPVRDADPDAFEAACRQIVGES